MIDDEKMRETIRKHGVPYGAYDNPKAAEEHAKYMRDSAVRHGYEVDVRLHHEGPGPGIDVVSMFGQPKRRRP